MFTKEQILKTIGDKGYSLDKRIGYPNLVGVRFLTKINSFDDELYVLTYDNSGDIDIEKYSITTDPGLYAIHHTINPKGTAIIVPGFYKDLWTFGLHKGKYKAFVQLNKVSVYRDNNKDSVYDLIPETIDNGIFGINLHKAGLTSIVVDNWSYGCQVFKNSDDFDKVLKQAESSGYNKFNYILLNNIDI